MRIVLQAHKRHDTLGACHCHIAWAYMVLINKDESIVRERMSHFIKLKLLLGCFLGFSISFSAAIHAQDSQGFYLGISAIKDTSSYDFKRVETSPGLLFIDQDRFDWNGSGFGGELYIGYGSSLASRFFLAGEGFYNVSSNSGNIAFIDSNTLYTRQLHGKFRQRWQYGFAVRPGIYLYKQALFYGRIGWIVSNIQLSGGIQQTGNMGAFAGNFSSDKNCQGLQLGLGMEIPLISRLIARLEWDWNSLQDFSNQSFVRDTNHNPYTTFRNAFNPTLEQIKLGVRWTFSS
ncbi:Opacity protein and related surface antigens [Legionella feeleii]|uniref:Opacity protein and related surface antigens n=1 Tax=Legionella feeleii TaxID=453 RepID=A0A378IXP0_9GAMM|nr:Opacity protein and related surface antigens [Legionella feeleii]